MMAAGEIVNGSDISRAWAEKKPGS